MKNAHEYPLFIVGHMRSGTTIIHEMMLKACPQAVDLTDDDFESRPFWQAFGLRIGSRRTGTYCDCAAAEHVTSQRRLAIMAYAEQRCADGRRIVNKNPHLSNKIGFAAEVFPKARFVHIIREAMSVVSSTKLGFERANTNNEEYPPFVHYWPEGRLPCWWTALNDRRGLELTSGMARRWARGMAQSLRVKPRPRCTAPNYFYPHERLSRLMSIYPDPTRYYPGEGFARLPEAWATLNANIRLQLDALSADCNLTVTYDELVQDTRSTLSRILQFAELPRDGLDNVPEHLDRSRVAQWRKHLTTSQQERCREVIEQHREGFNALCHAAGTDLCAEVA